MSSSISKFLASFLQENAAPTLCNAYMAPSSVNKTNQIVATFWKQKCYETEKTRMYTCLYSLSKNESTFHMDQLNEFPIPAENYLLRSFSPSGKNVATIYKQMNKETSKEEDLLEIFSNEDQRIRYSVNLATKNKHGMIHANETFGSLNWSPNEESVVYIAEKKKPKHESYFESSDDTSKEKKESDKSSYGEKFVYQDSWGEQLYDVVNPVVCVFNLKKKSVEAFEISDDIDPAQAVFIDNETVIFEGILQKPYKLGRIYCQNRVSDIYSYNISEKSLKKLTNEGLSMSSCPRVSPDGSKIACLHKKLHKTGDPHSSAVKIMIINLNDMSHYFIERCESTDENKQSFPFYCLALSKDCWFSNGNKIVIEANVNFKKYACILDLKTCKTIQKIECSLLFGVFNDVVLTSFMKLNWKNAILQASDVNSTIQSTNPILNDFDVFEINNKEIISFGVKPKASHFKNEKFPVIVWPHGGPHTVYLNIFNLYITAFAQLGFGVVYVNYTGSTAFTEESLNTLPGKIGTLDVNEVHTVAQMYFDMVKGQYDPDNVFIFGGSHGGFLTAHHIGQFPDMYRAAALRNPVIEIAAMSEVSDIPDWCYVESGLPYNQALIPDAKNLEVMLSKSPIQYVKNVKAPVLLLIGEKDLRVPPFQGKLYHKLLIANGKVSHLLCYPKDSHPLSSIETECDAFVNTCRWFIQNGDLVMKDF